MKGLENDCVKVFQCQRTFERALTISGMLPVLAKAAEDCKIVRVAASLRSGVAALKKGDMDDTARRILLDRLSSKVLNTAKRVGKARFAQAVAVHAELATTIPKYIHDAVKWLEAE